MSSFKRACTELLELLLWQPWSSLNGRESRGMSIIEGCAKCPNASIPMVFRVFLFGLTRLRLPIRGRDQGGSECVWLSRIAFHFV